jgi:hypothetical protein
MKVNFVKQQILDIAIAVKRYKKLWVTSEGVMFRTENDAENAVRIKNLIIGEPSEFVGITVITEDMVALEKLREYNKDVSAFNALFENARIPIQRTAKEPEGRKFEEPAAEVAGDNDDLAQALGLSENAPEPEKPASIGGKIPTKK